MTYSLVDSHCHLDFDYSPKSDQDLVREAEKNKVTTLITIGTEVKKIHQIASISEKYPNVFHTVGVHPHDTKDMKEGDLDLIKKASQHSKCVAIGEIGLDYHYENSPKEIQITRFQEQLEIAANVQLPVSIHTRDAEPDTEKALEKHCQSLSASQLPGVIHCFTGTTPFALKCIDLGFYISFSGILTFKKSEELRETARVIPIEKILIETDSPFLAPIPHRGKRCEPAMLIHTAQVLAELKSISLEEVAQQTTQNARGVFKLPLPKAA